MSKLYDAECIDHLKDMSNTTIRYAIWTDSLIVTVIWNTIPGKQKIKYHEFI